MLAQVLIKRGGAAGLEIREVPDPVPGPLDAVIEVRAAGLNHLEEWARQAARAEEDPPPRVVGSDAVGVVAALGSEVEGLAVGDEVILDPGLGCGQCEWCLRGETSECPRFDIVGRGVPGTFAERVVAPAANLHPRPAHLGFEAAAALPLAHVTAWRMLRRGGFRPGQSVLVHGIGGGVALAALQLVGAGGGRAIVTSSSAEKLLRAASLGAEHGIDYGAEADVAGAVRRFTGGRGVDLVLDTVGAATWPLSVAAARNGGRVVVCGATGGAEATLNVRELFWRQVSVVGSTMGSRDDFRGMLAAVAAARIEPILDRVLPIARAAEALERLTQPGRFGKVVLSMGDGWPPARPAGRPT